MKFRDVIFWFHLVLGVIVGTIVLIMSVTGVILAYRPQILEFAEKDIRYVAPPSEASAKLSVDDLLAKAKLAAPDKKITGFALKANPNASLQVNFGKEAVLFLNPYTGDVLGGESPTQAFLEKVEVWHRWIGMEGKLRSFGHGMKGGCTIAFFFMVLSGIYLWWPQKWNWRAMRAIILFNPRLQGQKRDWNWHNVIGFWGSPFLLVIILTGIIMSYDWASNLLYTWTGSEPPVRMADGPKPKEEKSGERKNRSEHIKEKPASLDLVLAHAEEKLPNWGSMNVRYPQKPGAPINIFIEAKDAGNSHARSQLSLNSATAEIVKWEPASEQSAGRKLRTLARYAHTGEVGGWIGQTIAALTAAGAAMLVWTGFAMAWQRILNLQTKKKVKRTRSNG